MSSDKRQGLVRADNGSVTVWVSRRKLHLHLVPPWLKLLEVGWLEQQTTVVAPTGLSWLCLSLFGQIIGPETLNPAVPDRC